MHIAIGATSILAGLLQGTTGFGVGIALMMVIPLFFSVAESAAIVSVAGLIPNLLLVLRYRKALTVRKVLLPALLYIVACNITIVLSLSIDQQIIKKVFGVFLLILATYYLFFNRTEKRRKISIPLAAAFITISGVCDGLFAIGGPLMVVYYLSITESIEEYIGDIQLFFLLGLPFSIAMRLSSGLLGVQHVGAVIVCVAGLVFGMTIAKRIVGNVNDGLIRRFIYAMIAVSGVINLVR